MTTERNVEVLFLSKSDVESLCTPSDGVGAAELAFKAVGSGQVVQEHIPMFMEPDRSNMINSMPTYVKSMNLTGIKWINVYTNRRGYDLPAIWGAIIILNHPETALPYAIMDGTAITSIRTAGGHAVVAAKYLAKKDSKIMAIIGCGEQSRTGFRSFRNNFPLELVKINDIKPEAMTALKKEIGEECPVQVMPTASAKEAVEGADIILMVTSARRLVVLEPWVEKGSFVACMNGFFDLDPMLSKKADKWVLGIWDGDTELVIELPAIGQGTDLKRLSSANVYADMGEIVTGKKPGRENDQERIVYTHFGMGAHDIILAHIVYTRAVQQGKGVKLQLV